jgi:hypothetical protein
MNHRWMLKRNGSLMKINLGTTLFFVVCLIVIVAALVFLSQTEGGSPLATPAPTVAAQPLFPDITYPQLYRFTFRDETAAAEITFERPQTALITLTPAVGTEPTSLDWFVSASTNPIMGDLSQSQLDDAATALLLVNAESFTVTADQLAQFGLEQPLYTVTLQLDNNEQRVLRIGKATPRGDRYYALLGDDRTTVYILSGGGRIGAALNYATTPPLVPTVTPTLSPTLNLPGSLFAGYDATRINRFEVRDASGGVFVMQRGGDLVSWSVVEASNAQSLPLNSELVNAILGGYGFIPGNTTIEGADLAALGLTTPTYTLSAFSDTLSSFVLRVGAADVSGEFYYVQVNDITAQIALVPQDAITPFVGIIAEPPYLLPEVTAEATSETTAEATSEATAEATSEATAEAAAPTVAPTTVPPTVAPTTVPPTVAPTTVPPTVAPTQIQPTATATTIRPTNTPRSRPSATPTTIRPTNTPFSRPSATPTTGNAAPTATSTPRP